MLRYLPFVLIAAFALYCAFDVLGSDARRRRGVPTPVWVLVVLLPVLGGVVWLLVSRSAPGTGQVRPARGPVAPDDDPEFLRRLDLERRRREQQRGGAAGTSGDGPDASGPDGDRTDDTDGAASA